jgi:Fe-S cluster biosynthesis and repair protein YggX
MGVIVELECSRCGDKGEPPEPRRIVLPAEEKQRVLRSICAACWAKWEAVEIKIINEYRLNFADPEHRRKLQQACTEFLFEADQKPA